MADILQQNILLSCVHDQHYGAEQLIPHHVLGIIISGVMEIFTPDGTIFLEPGSIGIMRKNTLLKTKKHPSLDGKPFKSISLFLTEEELKSFALKNSIPVQERFTGDPLFEIPKEGLFSGFFQSLIPYFDQPDYFTPKIAELKTNETIELLLQLNTSFFRAYLFDFSEPHKIDLEGFMQRNFLFNIPIAEFARLTGRSLSTFKRDFSKVFADSPEKWLRKRRLSEAHSLLKLEQRKPSDVYLQVGFENFSHFSSAFKTEFGYSPSSFMR